MLMLLCSNVCRVVAENINVNTMLEQGFAYEKQGDFVQAIKIFEQVKFDELRLSKKTAVWDALSRCYSATGSYVKGIQCLNNLLGIVTSTQSRDALWLNISDNQWSLGDYDGMINSLDSVTDQSLTTTRRVNALASLAKYDDAKDLLGTVLNTNVSQSERTIAMQNMGYIEWARGDIESSKSWLMKAINLMDESDSNYAIAQATLGYVLGCNGEYSDGLRLIGRAISLQQKNNPDNHPNTLISIRKKAEIEMLAGDYHNARASFKQYFVGERKHLLNSLIDMAPVTRLSYWAKEKPLLSKCFLLENLDAEFLFEVAMFRRQTSLLGMRNTSKVKESLCVTPSQVRTKLKQNEAAVEIVSYESKPNKIGYAAIILPKSGKACFVHLIDESEIYTPNTVGDVSLYEAIRQDVSQYKNILYSDTIWGNKIWQPILIALPNTTRKIYFAPEGIFHVFGIENLPFDGKAGKEFHRVSTIASLVNRSNVKQKTTKEKALIVGGLNYDKNIDENAVSADANHEAADYLKSQVGYNSYFPYLKGTKEEVDTIITMLSNGDLLYDVSESDMKNLLPQFDVVHVATHGYCLNLGIRKRPEFLADSIPYDRSLIASGLALTGVNTAIGKKNGEDEILSAREICDLDLSNVDFVVLSACETAKGDISDEGSAGLVRGLKNAGVKTILATLWSVDDNSTMLFMKEFYRQLDHGISRYLAFIAAQKYVQDYKKEIEYRKFSAKSLARDKKLFKSTKSYQAPYYWAPFILIDEY